MNPLQFVYFIVQKREISDAFGKTYTEFGTIFETSQFST